MIFVTVGTHEQAFDRLIIYMDNWAKTHNEKVIMQIGTTTYKPKHCMYKNYYSYQEITHLTNKARIVICHGGPSSFIIPITQGKIPIVIPRRKEYSEHINNHQVKFCNRISYKLNSLIVVNNISDLESTISNYSLLMQEKKKAFNSNNEKFCKEFERIINDLL